MFNVYDFINSNDESKYLQSINFKFTSMQMAWIVFHCYKKNITLNQKQSAYKDIISNTDDIEIPKRLNCAYRASLHDFLSKYINLQNKIIQEFYNNQNAIYMFQAYSSKYQEWLENYNHAFLTFDDVFNTAKEDFDSDISILRIKKQSLLKPKEHVILDFSINKQILNINDINYLSDEESSLFYDSFDGMWFSFPVPFKEGDVVVRDSSDGINQNLLTSLCEGPFVLIGTTSTTQHKYTIEKGDNSDMSAYGYFQNENGEIYYEVMYNYFDLEYFKGDFSGKRRILKALSNCVKGDISEELFARAYHYILMDEYTKSLKLTDITEDALELLGLK